MRILLLEDNVRHRRAGAKQLQALGHEVVALCDYGEARERCKTEHFDVALLDLLMPAEPTTLGDGARKEFVGKEIAIGFPLVLDLSASIKLVAVATDMNHHNHPMSAAVDWFRGATLLVNGSRVSIMHAPLREDGTKDWGEVLGQIAG